jgi:stage II sporulation protein AA (anti-sigma F factor antagonist)
MTPGAMKHMTVLIERESGSPACVVRVDGDIDLAVVPEMQGSIDNVVTAGCVNVVLDLSHVSYADSSALGLLVWLDHRLGPLGGKLVLAGADHNVSRVLELSGLVGVAPSISASSTVRQALQGLEMAPEPPEPLWSEELCVPASVMALAQTRTRVVELLEPLRAPEAIMYDIKVAVGEALANAVRHGSPHGESDHVCVEVVAYSDRIVVRVRDSGGGFDGDSSCADDVYASGGRGVMFMRALMDRVEFARCDGEGTTVTLTKRIPTPADAAE